MLNRYKYSPRSLTVFLTLSLSLGQNFGTKGTGVG
jgi:hypothetical protein